MARTRLLEDQAAHVTTLEDLLPLDAFAHALVQGDARPKLYGLATSSKTLRDMARRLARSLQLSGIDGVRLFTTSSFPNCNSMSYECHLGDPEAIQALGLMLCYAASHYKQLSQVQLQLTEKAEGTPPKRNRSCSILSPLKDLSSCTNLASLALSTSSSTSSGTIKALTPPAIRAIAKLQGLRELTLKFPLPANRSYIPASEEASFFGPHTVQLGPFSQLTNLSRLTVQGVWPQLKAAKAGAAGADAAEGTAVKAYGSCLPSSLTSLVIEGGSGISQEGGFLLQNWFAQLRGVSQLQQLQLADIRLDESDDHGDGVDIFSNHWDFDQLPALRELRFSFAAEDLMGFASGLIMPPAMSKLSSLQVLWVGAHEPRYPWQQFYWFAETEPLADLLSSCSRLREFGQASDPQWVPATTERLSIYAPDIDSPLPSFAGYEACMNISSATSTRSAAAGQGGVVEPQLRHLEIECHGIGEAWVLHLAELTKLTFLRLDSSYAFANIPNALDGWSDMSLVGRSLPLLQRLELICCSNSASDPLAGADSDGDDEDADVSGSDDYPALVLPPGLSAFTQVKELLLGCIVDPDLRQLPRQPKAVDFLGALSGLTQLEVLELEGYAGVSPIVAATLVLGCLPELRKLHVGRCNHPAVAAAAAAAAAKVDGGDEGGGDRDGLTKALVRLIRYAGQDVQWKELIKMYKLLRPELELTVAFARQWQK